MSTTQIVRSVLKQMNLPNWLSFSRILLGITVGLWWIDGSLLTLSIVLFAGLSDGLDGYLARKRDEETPLGKVLDPIADKLFVLPILWYLAIGSNLAALYALAVVTTLYDVLNTYRRRLDISLAAKGWYLDQVELSVSRLSKTKTAFLFVTILGFVPETPTWITNGLALSALAVVSATLWRSYRPFVTSWLRMHPNVFGRH